MKGLPAEFLAGCEIIQLESMARESMAPGVWRALEARLGTGPMLDDGDLPFSYRLDGLRRKLGEADAELSALAAWIATDTIDEVWCGVMELFFELGDHALWRDEVMRDALFQACAGMTLNMQERLRASYVGAIKHLPEARFVGVMLELFERLHGEDGSYVSAGWMLCLATRHEGTRVDEAALIQRVRDASRDELLAVWLAEAGYDVPMTVLALYVVVHEESELAWHMLKDDQALRTHAIRRLKCVLLGDEVRAQDRAMRDCIAGALLVDTPEVFDRSEDARVLREAIDAYLAQLEREGVTASSTGALHRIAERSPVIIRRKVERKLSGWVEGMDDSNVGALTHVDGDALAGQLSLGEE